MTQSVCDCVCVCVGDLPQPGTELVGDSWDPVRERASGKQGVRANYYMHM